MAAKRLPPQEGGTQAERWGAEGAAPGGMGEGALDGWLCVVEAWWQDVAGASREGCLWAVLARGQA